MPGRSDFSPASLSRLIGAVSASFWAAMRPGRLVAKLFTITVQAFLIAGSLLVAPSPLVQLAAAAGVANIDQCANGKTTAVVACAGAQWQNGNLNENNSHYGEGDTVPYRIKFSGLAPTGTVSVTIKWDTTKSGTHALDYLTSFNTSETTANATSRRVG